MSGRKHTLRLKILGILNDNGSTELTCLAEFDQLSAVERKSLEIADFKKLNKQVSDLRGFIEANYPKDYSESALKELGEELFNLVVFESVKRLMDRAQDFNESLPLEMFIEDTELATLPWEYMFDPGIEEFICRYFHPISRGIFNISLNKDFPPIEKPIKILILVGVLSDDKNTKPQEEVQNIKNIFDSLVKDKSVGIDILYEVTQQKLQTKLKENTYQIIHFFGHGHFDKEKKQGYLKFELTNDKPYLYPARDFANDLRKWSKGIYLVFLNGCKTGVSSTEESPSHSSVAAALLKTGVPAVIANQFSIPAINAHLFSRQIYGELVSGKTLGNVVSDSRITYLNNTFEKFTHWGIPVLYTHDPNLSLFPKQETLSKKESNSVIQTVLTSTNNFIVPMSGTLPTIHPQEILNTGETLEDFDLYITEDKGEINFTLPDRTGVIKERLGKIPAIRNSWRRGHSRVPVFDIEGLDVSEYINPSVTIEQTRSSSKKKKAKIRVALVDFDTNAGFLPKIVETANKVQNYYHFQVSYLPLPSSAIKNYSDGEDLSQYLSVPELEEYLKNTPTELDVDKACYLTHNNLAGIEQEEDDEITLNLFSSSLMSNPDVSIISTYGLREYAKKAKTSFAKAVLMLCLAEIIQTDKNSDVEFHDKTYGCLFDYCLYRADIVKFLRRMKFDHQDCRAKIKDKKQLEAIDKLVELKVDLTVN